MTRLTLMPVNALVGPFLFPVMTALGLVLSPTMAAVHTCRNNAAAARESFHAWQVCVLVSIATVGFFMLSGYVLPPKISLGMLAALISTGIAFYAYRTELALRRSVPKL